MCDDIAGVLAAVRTFHFRYFEHIQALIAMISDLVERTEHPATTNCEHVVTVLLSGWACSVEKLWRNKLHSIFRIICAFAPLRLPSID